MIPHQIIIINTTLTNEKDESDNDNANKNDKNVSTLRENYAIKALIASTALNTFSIGDNNCVCISVGSGTEAVEKMSQISYSIKKYSEIITVDPDPESFIKYDKEWHYMEPMFPTVDELISTRPEAVNNCDVPLIWPYD